jgi:hypothetical protein
MYTRRPTYTHFTGPTEMLARARLEQLDREIERIARANLALAGRPPRCAVLQSLVAWLHTRLSGRSQQRPIGIPHATHGGPVSTSVSRH